ncbi:MULTISPECIES: MTAP family purine nucleoside phosphorylase [unclassified Candidatus Frackibacter]|uniref:MTAP family purine nucleoside phosphorylase n=1 Tax=unclassified Candidatus Frackibacter TaxID=2648818 RepID=UPI0008909654|nr:MULTISPECIES: MTAP family purine nucleoside phosphorylase [unclassified Candidatus Frackibacter]SDC17777.1 5'-methylthioadenosine phosphorylase [Candidatus Frackibacter sp. WG11]SEM44217.1 5'-methylthioadenosine phosphorylase [Candidatus Frackibacter sp. WG12]SFL46759.1 5'-methylthioadenosine phosphorylase [Candidatus Frackibacter sp. WG13]
MAKTIPEVDFAIIGGSSTYSISFPEDLAADDVEILDKEMIFSTPYGDSPKFKLFRIGKKKVLTCKMHGWRKWQEDLSRAQASQQVFWVLMQAGVKKIMAEGGVGAINHLLEPRDIVVPTDYIDQSLRKDVDLNQGYLLMMRQAICPDIHQALYEEAQDNPLGRTFSRSNYVVTDGRHFESPAEIQMYKQSGGDVVGQTLCPEVYLAREIGACYAAVYLVVNYAEGIVEDWSHDELSDLFHNEGEVIGNILLDALRKIDVEQECGCNDLRKPTMIKEENRGE